MKALQVQRVVSSDNGMKVEVDLVFRSVNQARVVDAANKVCAELQFLLHRTQFPTVSDILQSLLSSVTNDIDNLIADFKRQLIETS